MGAQYISGQIKIKMGKSGMYVITPTCTQRSMISYNRITSSFAILLAS